jgi:hypothetical protein
MNPSKPNDPVPGNQPNWSKLPIGQFSGIDYSENGAADGLDAYFVWADVNGFAHLRTYKQQPGDTSHIPQSLPVLIELAKGVSPLQVATPERTGYLQVPKAYLELSEQYIGGLIPAIVGKAFFQELRRSSASALSTLVKRVEMDLPQDLPLVSRTQEQVKPTTQTRAKAVAQSSVIPTHNLSSGEPLQGMYASAVGKKVIAFIDDGCAFAHHHFLSGDPSQPHSLRTRVVRLWDMNEASAAALPGPPTGQSEGREYTDADLSALIQARVVNGFVDEEGVYADFATGNSKRVNRLMRKYAHGAGVMQLASGPYFVEDRMCTRENGPSENPNWASTADAASEAQIIFVQLPMRTVQDTTLRGTMQQDVINAFEYILHVCPADAQIVVNLSWGTLAGSHTGTNLLEQEIDRLITLHHPRLQVVVPVGNGYQSRTHANFLLKPHGRSEDSATLYWRTQPDDGTESYLEIWLEEGAEVTIDIYTPASVKLSTVQEGDVKFLNYVDRFSQPNAILGVCYNRALQGPQGVGPGIVLALAPTTDMAGVRATTPHGVWKIEIKNVKSEETVVDAYIERDDDAAGTRRGSRQSYLDHPEYDRAAIEDGSKVTDYANPVSSKCIVRREGVYNSIATGKKIVAVGGVRQCDLQIAEYSPRDIYTGRRKRPGTPEHAKQAIEYTLTEESKTLAGIRVHGSLSGGTVRLAGTSNAAPQIVRDLYNALTP